MTRDTIFAVSSGRPPAGIAVIRVSGPAAMTAATTLAGPLPKPRQARLRTLRDGTGAVLDQVLVLVFPGPATATGEDVVELHCHGGRAVVAAVEAALAALPGLRQAEPGEFTRRALMNGRIDLTEAEGLADLLAAETERQRQAAVGAAEGRLGERVRGWMAQVAILSALAEAQLDVDDEGEVIAHGAGPERIADGMAALATEIAAVLAVPSVERLREGIGVVIAGPPNAGKSTLLNLLSERDAAIVSPVAGTTRDRIDVPVSRGGIPYLLSDTAGLRDATADVIEGEGIDRAKRAIVAADILLWLDDTPPPPHPHALWIHGKADLPGGIGAGQDLAVSRHDSVSIEALWDRLDRIAQTLIPAPAAVAMNDRQRTAAAIARDALRERSDDPLLMAEALRRSRRAFASLLGTDATEAMLDALFGQFCLGK